jgi:uncharacterized damage-inducible protein DinB
MTNIEEFLAQWKSMREGLIKEVGLIPEEKLVFRATAETRSVLELVQHIVESERGLVGEVCRDDTDLRRVFTRPPDAEVRGTSGKDALIALLRSSMASSLEKIRQFGEAGAGQLMFGLDGKQVTKGTMLQFTLAHEMYHRGKLTVYQRLLGIEPALTEQFRQLTANLKQ